MGTFEEMDVERILYVPLSMHPHDDLLVWTGEPTGEYTVRSGHKCLLHNGQTLIQPEYKNFYKRLWTLDLPPKIKITNWRIASNYLPTFGNLYYRRLMGSATCRRRQYGGETREHLFR